MIIELAGFKLRVYFPVKRWILTNCPNFYPKARVMTLCGIKHTLCSCPYSERVFSRPNSRRRTTGHSECIVCVQSDHDERAQRGWLELTPAFTAGCSQPRRVWCLFPWRQRAAAQSWHEADGLVHTRAHLSLSRSLSLCLNVFLSLFVTAHICWYNAFFQSAQACSAIQTHFFIGYKQDVFLHTLVISNSFGV